MGKRKLTAKQRQKVEDIINSCGCVFCDLDLRRTLRGGKFVHWCNEVEGNWVDCFRPN